MLVPWFNYNVCSITRDSQGKRVQFARQHAKVRDFTSRHACLEVKFGFRQVQVCFIGGSLPVILSSMRTSCQITCTFKGKWQQKFLWSHLKETLKIIYIKAFYKIFISVLLWDILSPDQSKCVTPVVTYHAYLQISKMADN